MKIIKIACAVLIPMLLVTGAMGQDYSVNTKKSTVKWKGEKITGEHTGAINVKSGTLTFEDNSLSAVSITMNMESIIVTDLSGGGKNKLESHLRSPDFFDVKQYPEATFTSTEVVKTDSGYDVSGKLNIKGMISTNTISVKIQRKANTVHASGTMVFDRSKHNVRYGSGSFFDDLGDKQIYDDVELEFSIMAETN